MCFVCCRSLCRASSSSSDIRSCKFLFSLSKVLTLLLPKREPTLSAMLVAVVVAAPFSFSVCTFFWLGGVLPLPLLSAPANPPLPLSGYQRVSSSRCNTAAWTCAVPLNRLCHAVIHTSPSQWRRYLDRTSISAVS